jgi:hypothetical protein
VGEIPTEVGLMTSLTYMNAFFNHFTGKIPSEIGLLTALEHLNLGSNEFTGSVPSELGSLSQLEVAYFQGNDLVEGLENLFCIDTPDKFASDCFGVKPEIICGCCNFCCDLADCYAV